MIKNSSIEALKSRLDIVDVVGSYVELKKSGTHFKARCPFHDEKTPSFMVNPAKQIYHCFGCGAGGDAITFVREIEKLSYPETIEKLAREYNVHLEYEKGSERQDNRAIEQLGSYFVKRLATQPQAKAYLEERGIFHSSIEKFQIGYAPGNPEQMQFFEKNFIKPADAMAVGIMAQDDNGRYYARFIERITFPIHSQNGMLVGFGGRTITGHPAKYINSPQSKLFNKSRLLYAYHLAKEAIFRQKEIIVTEGYLDVVMLHQAGFSNVVATLGTALTNEHIPLLMKGEPKVIVAYDGDNAGKAAALKAARLLAQSNLEGGVVLFGEGKDPADLVKEGRSDYLNQLFKHPIAFVDFIIEMIVEAHNMNTPRGKAEAINEAKAFLRSLPKLAAEHYTPYAARMLACDINMLRMAKELPNVTKQTAATYDIAEASILKTLIQKPELVDDVLDICDESFFEYHRDIFVLLLRSQFDHERVLALEMEESIQILQESDLRQKLTMMSIKRLEREIAHIVADRVMDGQRKMFELRDKRHKITKLRKKLSV